MFSTRLHRSRKASGLTLRALGERVGVSHVAIKKYEDGLAMPSSDILLKLSRELNVRTEYFFRPESVALENLEYRKRSRLPMKQLDAITHEVIDRIERRMELENLFPQAPVKAFAPVEGLPKTITRMDQIESAAACVREAWRLGSDPILDLVGVLETNGIRVFMIETNAESRFDGLAAHAGGMPVVVVDSNWPGDRQRFTLSHELGHFMLKGRLAEALDEEKACNRFAGAFLLPDIMLHSALGTHRTAIELKELGLLKEAFGVSMSAILIRARDLGIITPAYYLDQVKRFRANGWHKVEPGKATPPEKTQLFEQLVFHALAEEYIGESKAAELMNLSQKDFRRLRAMEGSDAAAHQ